MVIFQDDSKQYLTTCVNGSGNDAAEIRIKARVVINVPNRISAPLKLNRMIHHKVILLAVLATFSCEFSEAQTNWCNVGGCGTSHVACNNNGVSQSLFRKVKISSKISSRTSQVPARKHRKSTCRRL